jgi:hypothetical protein
MITDIILSSDIIAEGVPNGTSIASISITDESTDSHTLLLVDDADRRFKLEGNVLIVRDTTRLDYETNQTHDIEIQAIDPHDATFNKVFTINVTDSDVASEIHSISPKATQENTNPEIIITGNHFAEGGEPVVRIDGEPVSISSYTDTEIRFVLTTALPAKVYTVTVFNGIGL